MIRMLTLIFLLFFLTKSIIFFTSLYLIAHHHGLLASTHKFINFIKSNQMTIFFIFNAVIISILVGSSKSSEMDHDQLFYLPVAFPPPVYDERDENGESHGFSLTVSVMVIPSLVLYEVEDKEEASYDEEDDEYHGFDGYEEDNESGCSEDEDEDDSDIDEEERGDLARRIQEFIDKVYRKWGEELYDESLRCLPAPQPR